MGAKICQSKVRRNADSCKLCVQIYTLCPLHISRSVQIYTLCPLHIVISRSDASIPYARFTLADPMPRLCHDRLGQYVNGFPTRNRLSIAEASSGDHREVVRQYNRRECTHCAPFSQCEWVADATSVGFVPICLRLHRRPIGASANVKRALHFVHPYPAMGLIMKISV